MNELTKIMSDQEKQQQYCNWLMSKINKASHKHISECGKEPSVVLLHPNDLRYIQRFYSIIYNNTTINSVHKVMGMDVYRTLDLVEGEIKVL